MKKGCFENSTKKILNGRWRYTENSKKEDKNFFKKKKTNIKNHNLSKLHWGKSGLEAYWKKTPHTL